MAAAPNALQPVAWVCGNCAHINEGTEPGSCTGCAAPEPVPNMIFKKKTGITAPTARTCSVDRWTQIILSSAAAPADSLSRREVVELLTGNVVDIVGDGVVGCKVGFLPKHLATRGAGDYNGLYARVIEIYSVSTSEPYKKLFLLP